ncbi:hypothetical protein Ancab_007590 [Ancistrocladus abbreviatus]
MLGSGRSLSIGPSASLDWFPFCHSSGSQFGPMSAFSPLLSAPPFTFLRCSCFPVCRLDIRVLGGSYNRLSSYGVFNNSVQLRRHNSTICTEQHAGMDSYSGFPPSYKLPIQSKESNYSHSSTGQYRKALFSARSLNQPVEVEESLAEKQDYSSGDALELSHKSISTNHCSEVFISDKLHWRLEQKKLRNSRIKDFAYFGKGGMEVETSSMGNQDGSGYEVSKHQLSHHVSSTSKFNPPSKIIPIMQTWGKPNENSIKRPSYGATSETIQFSGLLSRTWLAMEKQEECNSCQITASNEMNGDNENTKLTADERYIVPINDGDEQIVDQQKLRMRLDGIYDKVLVVDKISTAKKVVSMLTNQYRHRVHACDTEVSKMDVKQESPVDHGEIICFSIYSGQGVDFGNGKSCVWVDILGGCGKDLLVEFAPFFEDSSIKKVWHNYSFDSHVIENYGIKLSGFHADTMHMARLWNSSRRTEGGYSLEALTGDRKLMSNDNLCQEDDLIGKISMKTIFGRRKVKKDGSLGKIVTVPPVEKLHMEERESWICYSSLDSISTFKLYEKLKGKLSKMPWKIDGKPKGSMLDFYQHYWQPFGELLVQMETEGILVDRAYLAEVEKVAIAEQQSAADRFRNWASRHCPDARYMNVGSDTQLRQLFFGGIMNSKDPSEQLPTVKTFRVPNHENVIEEGKKSPMKYRNITLHKIGSDIQTDMYTTTGWPSVSGDVLKILAGKVSAEYDFGDDTSELQSFDNSKAEELFDSSAYGTAYAAFGMGKEGREACHAIAALCEVCSIDSLISNFILPLQGSHIAGKKGRIHCSLNINTETGRLSARRPNLQNQPALEKDRYKIRQAFVAATGKSLIVADYGQLELRILAHLAGCRSMKEAFKAGGDFHSRTAMNMYPYIRKAVEEKQVLLEWHPQPGEDKPPVPLLKDAFGAERRKAKMLNFSIAYGKTPQGLAKDWKVSVKEARETVRLWYNDRSEVKRWQEAQKKEAVQSHCVRTLLGRARRFPSVENATPQHRNHIERAAINTPVQGSAADVAMCAMLEIAKNKRLMDLGWKLLLQIHDEVILEGPTESAEEARGLVVECMSKPFNGTNILDVDLVVDAKCAQNWYAAK